MESEELEDYQNFSVLFPCCNDNIVAKNGIGKGVEMIITTIKNCDFMYRVVQKRVHNFE